MKNLITYEEISELARPCSTDQEMAEAMIAEAQRVEIKPRIGDALLWKLAKEDIDIIIDGGGSDWTSDMQVASCVEEVATLSEVNPYTLLLNGGAWVDSCGKLSYLVGLKTALAYYALARIVRDGNIQATTYGTVLKDDQHSSDPEKSERQRQYRELFAQADTHMAEIINFLTKNCSFFPEYTVKGKMRSNRMTVRVIGK